MWNRRIVRGNTYAAVTAPQPDPMQIAREREAQRRRLLRVKKTIHDNHTRIITTPEPVQGRRHCDVQTDSFIEELCDRAIECEAETQTDFLIDRPASPLFVPAKIGKDVATQINDGDLFDFNREVEPILEVLVGKTIEQSMMEVLEEEELLEIRRHQEEFERQRHAELLEVQRMEAAEHRRAEEAARRRAQAEARVAQQKITFQKILSRSIAREVLMPLRDRCIEHLQERGMMVDDSYYEVEVEYMPSVINKAVTHVENLKKVHSKVLEKAIELAVLRMKERSKANIQKRLDEEEARVESLRQKEYDRRRKIREAKKERIRLAEEEARRIQEEKERLEREAEEERLRLEAEQAAADADGEDADGEENEGEDE